LQKKELEKEKFPKLKFEPKPEYLSKVKFPPILERRRNNHANESKSKTNVDNPATQVLDPVTSPKPDKILNPVKETDPEIISDSGKVLDSVKMSDVQVHFLISFFV